ncbi:hypothetical protein [Paraburkholderia elongata]|uniref:Uncharacterized protein n=1 Tax=Paraburkholderia elongata TaxID=2675747 RepID=A0A972SNX3_9BURK|nr:hypothetical protein [Paraburkholderia elongata]NPT58125.1 hypothetical protein [Paraburkholderia elongata]
MNQAFSSTARKHMPVVLSDGARTSISIPVALYDNYLTLLNGDAVAFRSHLNEVARTAEPSLGITRSQAVRFALDSRIVSMRTAAGAV